MGGAHVIESEMTEDSEESSVSHYHPSMILDSSMSEKLVSDNGVKTLRPQPASVFMLESIQDNNGPDR